MAHASVTTGKDLIYLRGYSFFSRCTELVQQLDFGGYGGHHLCTVHTLMQML